jgi:hypothetical protein
MATTRETSQTRHYCDAAMMAVGLAGTAMPFAGSRGEEAERWLRILSVSGAVGNAMQAIGVPEEPFVSSAGPIAGERRTDAFESVVGAAQASACARGTAAVATEDLLAGVHATYGPAFDHALAIRGTTMAEVLERVDGARRTATPG